MPKALAPRLYYCEKENSLGNLWVIIMEYVADVHMDTTTSDCEDIEVALKLLHNHKLIFGDLCRTNILCSADGTKLVDFDWCDEEGKAFYPPGVNLRRDGNGKPIIAWHCDTGHGTQIKKEHDYHMFEILKKNHHHT